MVDVNLRALELAVEVEGHADPEDVLRVAEEFLYFITHGRQKSQQETAH